MKKLNLNIKEIETLCKKHDVDKLYLFGSVLNERFNNESDVDFLVKFLPIDLFYYFENYLSLKEKLEKITGRKIDLVEEQSLRNSVLINSINQKKELVYG